MAFILEGKTIAQGLLSWCEELHGYFQHLFHKKVSLGVLQVGQDPASCVYIAHKKKVAETLGFDFYHCSLEASTSFDDIQKNLSHLIHQCHGVLVQLPLPSLNPQEISSLLASIPSSKDVDGLTPCSLQKPCTPLGCIALVLAHGYSLKGKNVTVVGRSLLVGKPLGDLLLKENASVSMTHSQTKDLKPFFDLSSFVFVAAGKKGLVTPDLVHPALVIVDVGIHRGEHGKLWGDVDPEVYNHVAAYSPVPGGVGPMTVACLMVNTLKAAFFQEENCLPNIRDTINSMLNSRMNDSRMNFLSQHQDLLQKGLKEGKTLGESIDVFSWARQRFFSSYPLQPYSSQP